MDYKCLIYIAIAFLIFTFICKIINLYNKLNIAQVKIDEALSGIDVSLAKRYEILTKMIEVVKGYVKYESSVLSNIINIRKGSSIEEKNKVNGLMNESMKEINLIVENYPQLKASDNFKILQQAIADAEEHLQASRRIYNANVSSYNQLILVFPSNIIAKKKHLTQKAFFEADSTEKENIKVEM